MGNLNKNTWITWFIQSMEMNSSFFNFVCCVTRIILKNIYTLYLSFLHIVCCCFFFLLSSLLYEPSPSFSYFVFVHLDNFSLIRLSFFGYSSWMKSSRVSSYCSRVHLYNSWSYRALLSWLFIMNRDFRGFLLLFKLVLLH